MHYMWMYYVLALCLYCFYSLSSFLVMFYSYYIDVRLSHLNKDYLLTYLLMNLPPKQNHLCSTVHTGILYQHGF